MPDEWTPTMEQVRAEYVTNRAIRVATTVSPAAEFDRWLAEHAAQVRAAAFRDAARSVRLRAGTARMQPQNYALNMAADVLNVRADRIAAGGGS